jgi:hypothetical protein
MTQFVRLGVRQVFWLCAALSGSFAIAVPSSVRAEVTVTGTSKEATIQINDATFEELLSALHDKLDLTYKSSAPLDQKAMDGTFAGPLTKILAPLLKGYDHVIKVQDGRISVVLTDQKKSNFKPISVAPAAASTASEANEPAAGGADKSAKNEVVTDSKKQGVVAPNGATAAPAPSTSPPPAPFAVTTFLETQMSPFMNQAAAAAKGPPSPAGASPDASQQFQQQQQQGSPLASQQFAAQQAAVAQTMQRANIALQSLVGSLNRLPQ